MNSSGIPGMALHQAISFFSPMMSVPETPAIFWPGCALLNLDPSILKKTLEILARTEPEIRLAAGCCGQPSFFLFPEKYPAYRKKLEHRLKKSGVKRIYTACPRHARKLEKQRPALSGTIPAPPGTIRTGSRRSGPFYASPASRSWSRSIPAPGPCAAETSI